MKKSATKVTKKKASKSSTRYIVVVKANIPGAFEFVTEKNAREFMNDIIERYPDIDLAITSVKK